jgi:CheY-like chemotaxis protein
LGDDFFASGTAWFRQCRQRIVAGMDGGKEWQMKGSALDILQVDDDPNDQIIIQAACRHAGITVNATAVDDGAKAISYLKGGGIYADRERFPIPALMLLDLKMPMRSGFEVLEWARRQPELKYLPVIVFTASNQEEDMKRAYELGANAYVVKPNNLAETVEALKAIKAFWLKLNEQPNP